MPAKENKTNLLIKSEEKDLQIWKGRVKLSEEALKKQFKVNADRWRDFYEGLHFKHINSGGMDNPLVINYTYSTIKAILPQVYYQDPYIYLQSLNIKSEKNQQDAEDYLNNCWIEAEIKRQNKRAALDYLVLGFGVGKLGYETKLQVTGDNKAKVLNDFNSELITEEYPYFLRQSPYDMRFDMEAKHFDNLRWLGCKYTLPMKDVKDIFNPEKEFEPGSVVDLSSYEAGSIDKKYLDMDLRRVIVYEIHNLVDKKILWFCSEYDKFLRRIDNPYKIKGSNFKLIYSNEVPDKLLPISDVSQIVDINYEMDRSINQILDIRDKSQRKILYEKDLFLNKEEERKFLNERDLQMVACKEGTLSDGKAKFAVFTSSAIDFSYFNTAKSMLEHFNNVSGVGNQQRGVATTKEQTAYETSVIDKNANLRNSDRIDVMTDFCKDIARDLLLIIQQYPIAEKEYYVAKTGETKTLIHKNIQGSYKPRIEIGSQLARDEGMERQFIAQFAPQMVNAKNADGTPTVNPAELFKYVMNRFQVPEEIIQKIINEVVKPKPEPPVDQNQIRPDMLMQAIQEQIAAAQGQSQGGQQQIPPQAQQQQVPTDQAAAMGMISGGGQPQ